MQKKYMCTPQNGGSTMCREDLLDAWDTSPDRRTASHYVVLLWHRVATVGCLVLLWPLRPVEHGLFASGGGRALRIDVPSICSG